MFFFFFLSLRILPLSASQYEDGNFIMQFLPKCKAETVAQFVSKQTALVDSLMKSYRRELPPLYLRDRYENVSKVLDFSMTFTYGKLLTMASSFNNEPEQYIQVIVESYVHWSDFRLQWDPANWSEIEMIMINRQELWIPDLMPVDLIDYNEFSRSLVQNVVIYPNGSCTLFVSAMMKLLCKLNTCSVTIGSVNFITTEMSLSANVYDKFDIAHVGNGAWKLTGIGMELGTFTNELYGWVYPQVTFNMTMKRSATYYVVMIILPSLILTTLTVLAMFWTEINDFSCLKKVTLGFSAFLSQTMLLQITTQNMPKTSHLPALSIFILWNLIVLTSSIISVLVTAKYFRYRKEHSQYEIKNPSRLLICWKKCLEKAHIIYMMVFLLAIGVNLFVLLI